MSRGEGIKPISSLFDKYKKQLVAPQGSVKKCFCEVIHDLYGLKVKEEEIEYIVHSKTIVLKTRGALKSELQLHKEEILLHLKGRLGDKSTPVTIL